MARVQNKNGYKANVEAKKYRADVNTNRTVGKLLVAEGGAIFQTEDNKILVVE